MIVSRPSISTTGPASEVEHPEVGQQVALLGDLEQLEAVVGARLLEDVDRRAGRSRLIPQKCRLRRRWRSRSITPGRGEARPEGASSSFRTGCAATTRSGCRRCGSSAASSSTGSKNPWFEHAEAELFLAERDGEAVGRITRAHRPPLGRVPGRQRRDVRLLRRRSTTRRSSSALVDAASALAARARPRADARPDGLHDERRVRDPDRGLRRAVDDPRALAPALLPAACSRRHGLSKAIDLLMWELWFGELKEGTEMHPLIHAAAAKSREEGVVLRQRCASATWRPRWRGSWRSTTRPGATTGASSRSPRPRSRSRPRT